MPCIQANMVISKWLKLLNWKYITVYNIATTLGSIYMYNQGQFLKKKILKSTIGVVDELAQIHFWLKIFPEADTSDPQN